MRSFLIGHVLSAALYCSEAYLPMLSETQQNHLEVAHLQGARSVSGVLSSTAQEDVLREAGLPWLRDIVRVRSLAYFERCRRLSGDRLKIATRELRSRKDRPFDRHPRMDSLLNEVCTAHGLDVNHPRLPLLEQSRYYPWDTGWADAVTVGYMLEGSATDPDDLRKEISLRALEKTSTQGL